jgi:hypothetical protein
MHGRLFARAIALAILLAASIPLGGWFDGN